MLDGTRCFAWMRLTPPLLSGETVYAKILGARGRFIIEVLTLEHLLLGLISAVLALTLSQIATWIVCMTVLEIAYRPFVGRSLLMILRMSAFGGKADLIHSLGVCPLLAKRRSFGLSNGTTNSAP